MIAQDIPKEALNLLRTGVAIPAHPLLLDNDRKLDTTRQQAVTRYYLDAGAGGIAAGVHTTQFAIRDVGLYEPVLRLAAETALDWTDDARLLIAGVTGKTAQATQEAQVARGLGYHAALLNLAHLNGVPEAEILEHCRTVAKEMPVIGFALLPSVGGFHLSYEFWKAFAQIENVIAIKMAPFDRYRTIDIVRAVYDAGAEDRITLYTGNDDHIILDLIQPFVVRSEDGKQERRARIRGGLLGHWSVWVEKSAKMLRRIQAVPDGADMPEDLLALDSMVTDCNLAIYDALNDLKGCIPGCLEVLRRQGLAENTLCLNPDETLSPGQLEQIDRVYRMYPEMNDDIFVKINLERWLSGDQNAHPLVT
ncbi:dihydrodipicolinate synthase family protein [Sulfitobacter mediterraneus]|uniref:dihydrodipicolinate synthase family protein n=1 Tax=Sulfitobacter mediterraneus TaxID=83219 RepID=UPI0019347AAB|nr:dihydrodipicolinate synthase family protein [Sulfitobacter mediterraneus]MBM1633994.1 dihydrodipicolinate synthase family protein [Sulfitobacter mediterraneus]MBM1641490.1 dihydrodipicolinate synthase family protein [Sulfitobacter mediterraneus]MBM1645859.1 dihydrodipicolinate synthase family protein [Sulfitobacter mediterraneus]MBM1649610.1 dihydrodipicolinate synthase family protein [Sulfitobacter mediterraneus]MBM1653928.1 dihydrodipicolinate synthase family protein [Sulfitobacter medite